MLLVTTLMNWRHRNQSGMGTLAKVLFFILVWSVTVLLEVMAVESRGKIFFVTIEYAVAGIYTSLLLLFVLRYYHRAQWLTGRWLALFWAFPVIDALAAFTNPWHSLVLTLLGEGVTDEEMSERLSLSVSTVRVHIFNMLRKLGLQNRQQVVWYLLKQNPPDAPI